MDKPAHRPNPQARSAGNLPAYFIRKGPREGNGLIAAHCPWCRKLHYHSAGGQGATPRRVHVTAQCDTDSRSPFLESGCRLTVIGEVQTASDIPPNAPGWFFDPLTNDRIPVSDLVGREVRSAIIHPMLRISDQTFFGGSSPIPNGFRLLDGSDFTFDSASAKWRAAFGASNVASGKGMPGCIAYLLGIRECEAFLLLIEAVTGITFDDEARQSFQDTFREWSAANRPEGRQ